MSQNLSRISPPHAMQLQAMTPPAVRPASLPYLPGLDGLRALAVIAVLIYHSWLGWLTGGFLGVEVFFIISGYLITALLLAEWHSHGRIDPGAFWRRRARRLVPAMFALIGGTLAFVVLFLPAEVARLRGEALAALAYLSNWYLIFSEHSYFELVGRPPLFQHLWSLAIEGQFYLLWPLLFAFGMRRHPRAMPVATLVGALASALLLALLYQPGHDPSRVYYGTDTRAAGLLYGSAFALVYPPDRLPTRTGRTMALQLDLLGLGALAILIAYFFQLNEVSPLLYRGGFTAVAIITLLLITVVVHPCSFVGWGVLGSPPLQWIGLRSYSLYLWHWPVFMLTRPQTDLPIGGLPLLALRLVLTFLLAELSFRYIEQPFRTGAVQKAWRAAGTARGVRRWRLGLQWGTAMGTGATLVLLLILAVVQAPQPEPPAYLQALMAPTTVMNEPAPASTRLVVPAATPILPGSARQTLPDPAPGWPDPVAPPLVPAPLVLARPVELPPEPVPTETPLTSLRVTAVGDSVMLGAGSTLANTITNIDLDAAVSRQVAAAIDILRWKRDSGQLGEVVVIHIGNNGYFAPGQFDEIMQILADTPTVLFVNIKVPRQWEAPNNGVIAEGVSRYPNTVLVDWHTVSSNRPDFFWYDGYHLRPEGAQAYADLILSQISTR